MDKKQVLAQQALSALVFIAIVVMLGWLSTRYKVEADWTAGNRNTLTDASVKFLGTLKDPIKFVAPVYPGSAVRQTLDADFERYRRVKKDISVEYFNPTASPQKAKDYNVSREGEVVAEYQGRREALTATTEQAITTTLQRLSQVGERWIVFLEGHGEHAIGDTDQSGYSDYAQLLKDKGLKLRSLNLATDPKIPDNVSAVVLAGPAKGLLPGESKLLAAYVKDGGNLLWLADPTFGNNKKQDPEASLEELASALGIAWQKGTMVMPESPQLGLSPFIFIATQYPANPVTKDFPDNSLFPLVRGLTYKAPESWNAQPLLTSLESAWLSANPTGAEPSAPDVAGGDTKGPLTLGVTLTREVKPAAAGEPARSQRIAVIGDSDFLTNQVIGQAGNGLFGLNLAQWLSLRDDQLNIDVPKAPDRSLDIGQWAGLVISIGFQWILPALLMGFGIARWIVRRRK